MQTHIRILSLVIVAALAATPWITGAETTNTAILPVPREAKWVERHEGFVAEAKQSGINVLFLGDSITDGWRKKGKAIGDERFASLKAANFGISGDRTQHVLWRMQNGELDGPLSKEAIPDLLQPNEKGYQIWADAIQGTLAVMMK